MLEVGVRKGENVRGLAENSDAKLLIDNGHRGFLRCD
jgi:hypothetical protein